MMPIRAAVFCLLLVLLTAHRAGAVENVMYFNFATCAAKIDGVPFKLDLFEELHANPTEGSATGRGFILQTMGGENGLKMLGQIDVKREETLRKVNMYTVLEPQRLFAQFEIPRKQQEFKLDVYAIDFRANWATFECQSK